MIAILQAKIRGWGGCLRFAESFQHIIVIMGMMNRLSSFVPYTCEEFAEKTYLNA